MAALLKVTPEGWVEKVNTKKYFDEDVAQTSGLVQRYNQVANAKVGGLGGGAKKKGDGAAGASDGYE